MKIKIKLNKDAIMPAKATDGSAAYDVYIPKDSSIVPGRQIVSLDFSIELPLNYEAKIEPRSGFSSKGMEDSLKIRRNADVIQGKIDSDYRGIVGVIIKSDENKEFILSKGTRIAQMTFYKVETADFETTNNLSETERGSGGFGHTGVK